MIVARSLRDRCVLVAPTYLAGLQLPLPHLPKIVPVHMAFAKLFSHLGDLVAVQGKRPVSAALQTATEAGQHAEALKDCLGAASTAFTAREVSGWCMCRRSFMSLAHLQLTLLR